MDPVCECPVGATVPGRALLQSPDGRGWSVSGRWHGLWLSRGARLCGRGHPLRQRPQCRDACRALHVELGRGEGERAAAIITSAVVTSQVSRRPSMPLRVIPLANPRTPIAKEMEPITRMG